MAGRLEVAPVRDTHRAVLVAIQTERERDPARVTVCRNDDRRLEDDVALGSDRPGQHTDHTAGTVVDDGLRRRRLLVQRDSEFLRAPGQDLIEVEAGADQAVIGKAGEFGPRQLHPHAASNDPQALVVQPARFRAGIDAELHELLHGAWGEAVAAHLFAREGVLLEQHDVDPGLREMGRGRGARRAGADHDHVGLC